MDSRPKIACSHTCECYIQRTNTFVKHRVIDQRQIRLHETNPNAHPNHDKCGVACPFKMSTTVASKRKNHSDACASDGEEERGAKKSRLDVKWEQFTLDDLRDWGRDYVEVSAMANDESIDKASLIRHFNRIGVTLPSSKTAMARHVREFRSRTEAEGGDSSNDSSDMLQSQLLIDAGQLRYENRHVVRLFQFPHNNKDRRRFASSLDLGHFIMPADPSRLCRGMSDKEKMHCYIAHDVYRGGLPRNILTVEGVRTLVNRPSISRAVSHWLLHTLIPALETVTGVVKPDATKRTSQTTADCTSQRVSTLRPRHANNIVIPSAMSPFSLPSFSRSDDRQNQPEQKDGSSSYATTTEILSTSGLHVTLIDGERRLVLESKAVPSSELLGQVIESFFQP